MVRNATSSNEHDWLINQNLDDLLGGNQAETVEKCPKQGTPRAQYDFDNDSHVTFNYGGDKCKANEETAMEVETESQDGMMEANTENLTSMASTFNRPPEEIARVSRCDESTLGNPTADSRMSEIEDRVDTMEQILKYLRFFNQMVSPTPPP